MHNKSAWLYSMSTNLEWNLGLQRLLSDSKAQIWCGECHGPPPSSPFKEELVVQLLGICLADGLQLLAPPGIASATESCPVRGHSPPWGSSHTMTDWCGDIKASQPNLVQLWRTTLDPELPVVEQGCHWVYITLFLPLPSPASLPFVFRCGVQRAL